MLFVWCAVPVAQAAPDAFPRLSDNTAGSASLEVRKVLHGQVDGLFAVPGTRQIVAVAGGILWKFSAQGVLQDSLPEQGAMFTSGLALTPDHCVDWVFTGDAHRKAYGPTVDGNGLSPAELLIEFQRADVVEFGKTDTAAWAYLWSNGQAWKVDISSHREQVDTYCGKRSHTADVLSWNATCFEGLRPARSAWREVEPGSFVGYGDPEPRLEVVDFDRRRFHLEEGVGGQLLGATVGVALKAMGMPGSLPGRYWFGDAHIRLRAGGEVVQFKAFVPYEDGEYQFLHNMRWWEPAELLPGASPWFSVHRRSYMSGKGEAELLPHYERDIGLYVVRPRHAGEVAAAQRTTPAWRPVFEGPATRNAAVTGVVEFASPQAGISGQTVATLPDAPTWLRAPPARPSFDGTPPPEVVNALWPSLHQVPAALTVAWGRPSAEYEYTQVRIELDGRETLDALNALPVEGHTRPMKGPESPDAVGRAGADQDPFELVVQVPDLETPLNQGQVVLRKGGRQWPLRLARWSYVVRPVERVARRASKPTTLSIEPQIQQLQAAVQVARQDARTGVPLFLQQAQAMAQDGLRVATLAPHLTAAYAELLNHTNLAGDFASSSTLVRHYLDQIHPRTAALVAGAAVDNSQVYNQGVIASQALAFAIHLPRQQDLVDDVMATLIGPDFDPQRQTNGTLMYNLACYHAVRSDQPRLLEATRVARRLGKPVAQFMADPDFERYRADSAFLDALQLKP
jgi:hypothetical protein